MVPLPWLAIKGVLSCVLWLVRATSRCLCGALHSWSLSVGLVASGKTSYENAGWGVAHVFLGVVPPFVKACLCAACLCGQ